MPQEQATRSVPPARLRAAAPRRRGGQAGGRPSSRPQKPFFCGWEPRKRDVIDYRPGESDSAAEFRRGEIDPLEGAPFLIHKLTCDVVAQQLVFERLQLLEVIGVGEITFLNPRFFLFGSLFQRGARTRAADVQP